MKVKWPLISLTQESRRKESGNGFWTQWRVASVSVPPQRTTLGLLLVLWEMTWEHVSSRHVRSLLYFHQSALSADMSMHSIGSVLIQPASISPTSPYIPSPLSFFLISPNCCLPPPPPFSSVVWIPTQTDSKECTGLKDKLFVVQSQLK